MVVWKHALKALYEEPDLSGDQRLAVELGALLHEVDDHKLFSDGGCLDEILTQSLPSSHHHIIPWVKRMVELVPCSSNGNHVGDEPHWYYIPRDADRIEANGAIGILRWYKHNQTTKQPLYLPTTPRATTVEELYAIATPERFARYSQGGQSESGMDHFYDKLLHLNHIASGNSYLKEAMAGRHKVVEDYALGFGRLGELPYIPGDK